LDVGRNIIVIKKQTGREGGWLVTVLSEGSQKILFVALNIHVCRNNNNKETEENINLHMSLYFL